MNQEKVGKYIKSLRVKNSLTQKEFADKLGVTYQAVSKWENGKNIPDIITLKEISKLFNVDISEILDGKSKNKLKKNSKKPVFVISLILFVLVVVFIIILNMFNKNNSSYEFKKLSTTCDDFKISGVAAYNKEKSSIYISNIEFCGVSDETKYKTIDCILYEDYQDTSIKVNVCDSKNNLTLKDYLKDVLINVENYSSMCKTFKNSNFYLEIKAVDTNNKTISYKIPINLDKDCSK